MTAQAIPAVPPIVVERPGEAAAIDALVERAFGPGRYARAAERLREGNRPIAELSFVAWQGRAAAGCVRLWPIAIGEAPALLLGPLAVDGAWQGRGLGRALLAHACEAAARAGHALILLVGDEPYYAPFGFAAAPARAVVMPGPVDQRRVLVRALIDGAAEGLSGKVTGAA
jgi:predicted N-acetyltransferase YhbS